MSICDACILNEYTAPAIQMVTQLSGLVGVTNKKRTGIAKRSRVINPLGHWNSLSSATVNGGSFGGDGSPFRVLNIKHQGTRQKCWLPWPWAVAALGQKHLQSPSVVYLSLWVSVVCRHYHDKPEQVRQKMKGIDSRLPTLDSTIDSI